MDSDSNYSFDAREFVTRLLKYFFEGLVVAVAAYALNGKRTNVGEVVLLGLVASATFSLLDLMAPSVGSSVRTGAGLGIGLNLTSAAGYGMPNQMARIR